jgi:hypothetical protein
MPPIPWSLTVASQCLEAIPLLLTIRVQVNTNAIQQGKPCVQSRLHGFCRHPLVFFMEKSKQWRDAIRAVMQVITSIYCSSHEFSQHMRISRTIMETSGGVDGVFQSKAFDFGRVVELSTFEKVRRIVVKDYDVQIEQLLPFIPV